MRLNVKLFYFITALVAMVSMSSPSAKEFDLEAELQAYKGKVVYLDYWASWCIPCRKSFPWMNEMQAKYGGDKFAVVSVNLDSDKLNATKFLETYPARFSVLFDPQGISARKLRVKGMPSSYLIDHNGKFRNSHVGFFENQKSDYEKEIVALIEEAK